MQNKKDFLINNNSLKPLLIIRPLFFKYRYRISLGIFALLAVDLFQLFIPRVIRSAVDGLDSMTISTDQLFNHAVIIVVLALGVAFFRFFWRSFILGFSRLLEADIRNIFFDHLLTLDRAFFQRRTTGELMALATNDLSAIQLACGMGLVAFVDALIMTGAVLCFMLYINPFLTLIALSPLPALAIITKILSSKLHRRFANVQKQFSVMTEMVRTTISSIRLIKIYTREEDQVRRFDDLGKQYIDYNLKLAKIKGTLFPFSSFIGNASLILVVLVGGRMAINQLITIGDFVAFISYLFMMTWPMMAFGWVTNLFQRGLTSLGRIQEILDEKPVLSPIISDRKPPLSIEAIQIDTLSFTYPGQQKPVLNNLNFSIGQGVFGIVGKTGSGKSTLCHLLARLYPINDHCIYFNEIDINTLTLNSCRRLVSYAPQEPLLFSDTIAFNISFGLPDASEEKIIDVAKKTGIHDEIQSFPEGYQTKIGEKGVKLSGGQRQRISLARALLTNSAILVIDDGLSAVDAGTETHILNSLKEFAKDKVVIIVSHRLTNLTDASQIAVIDNGSIQSLGTHHQLLSINEYYRTIYQSQADLMSGNNN